MKYKIILILVLLFTVFLSGCGDNDYYSSQEFCRLKGYQTWKSTDNYLATETFYCMSYVNGIIEVSEVYRDTDREKIKVYINNNCNCKDDAKLT